MSWIELYFMLKVLAVSLLIAGAAVWAGLRWLGWWE